MQGAENILMSERERENGENLMELHNLYSSQDQVRKFWMRLMVHVACTVCFIHRIQRKKPVRRERHR
jgi:hypothetical protein